MSTNISEIMFEMEEAGIDKARVADIVTRLLIAGQQTVYAQRAEQALRRVVDHGLGGDASAQATRSSQ